MKKYKFLYLRQCPTCMKKFKRWSLARYHYEVCGAEYIIEEYRVGVAE